MPKTNTSQLRQAIADRLRWLKDQQPTLSVATELFQRLPEIIKALDASAIEAERAISAQGQREPTEAQVNSACMSFRHDFGLISNDARRLTQGQAREWLKAWQKEGFAVPPHDSGEKDAVPRK